MVDGRIIWRVRQGEGPAVSANIAVIVKAETREHAKSYSSAILGGDPDKYEVEPLTERGTRHVFILND